MEQRACTKCLKIQDISQYCKLKCSKDGISYHCKTCRYEYKKTWNAKNSNYTKKQLDRLEYLLGLAESSILQES